jgi:hypothetical protein
MERSPFLNLNERGRSHQIIWVHPSFVALTLNPSPKLGRGTSIRLPLSQVWEKGVGDEGESAKLGCTRLFKDRASFLAEG